MKFSLIYGLLPMALVLALPLSAQTAGPVPCTDKVGQAFCANLNLFYTRTQALQAHPADDQTAGLTDDQLAILQNLVRPATDFQRYLRATVPDLNQAVETLAASKLASLTSAAQLWDQLRLDRDGAAASSSTGTSTDLVQRPGVTELVSAALGVGAASQTISGNTGTIHVNAGGLLSYLETGSVLSVRTSRTDALAPPTARETKTRKQPLHGFDLHNLEASFTFDLNGPSTTTVPVSGSATSTTPTLNSVLIPTTAARWSGASARYAIAPVFDPNSSKFQQAWATAYNNNLTQLQAASTAALQAIDSRDFAMDTDLDQALANKYSDIFLADATASKPQQLAADFSAYCKLLFALLTSEHPDLDAMTTRARIAVNTFDAISRDTLAQANAAVGYPLLVEYDYNRPASQPATHLGKFILSRKSGMALYTLNVAGTVYDGAIPAGAAYGRFRDVQASGQIDTGMGKNNVAILSGAFYYQYQKDPTVLNITSGNLAPGTNITLPSNAQVLLGTAGNTVVGQLKATINLKSGLKIPFAFKFSNRTDLINANEKVGQVGITYDFSSFSSLLGAKTAAQ